MGQGAAAILRSKIRAISRVFVVIHGGVLLLAAYYGAHVGERALISATARLVAPADLAPFIALGFGAGEAPLFPLPFLVGAGTVQKGLG